MITRPTLALLMIISMSASSVMAGTYSAVHEYRLKNGLKLIIKEDHRAPVVISQLSYKVGSADEHNGITGLSHVLEHMMFKGTKRYPAGHFSALIAENGGRENAFTSRDYTGYYQLLEKSRLEVSFDLESDRMRNLTLPEQEYAKEIEVVKEERRLRVEDNPNSLTYEQLYATAFNTSPYRNPVIGWMADLEHMELKDLRHWYDSWYVPNNATLVVVGDVNPEEVHRLAEKYYGGIASRQVPERKPRREVLQRGERRAKVKAPAKLPYLVMGYKVPVLGQASAQWEPYALEVLAGVLDAGRSSRLSKRLIREQEVAASAGASYSLYGRYNTLFILHGIPAQGHSLEEVEQALGEEITALKATLVEQSELKRVKAQVVAEEVYEQDSINSQASLIGSVEAIGLDWRVLNEYVGAIQAITAEQVRAVAQKYLVSDHRTVVVLEPLPIGTPAKLPRTGSGVGLRG
jgi:zinc protease